MCFQPTGHLFRETICCGSSVFGDLEVAVILKYFNLQDNVRLSSGSSLASLQKRHAAIWYGRVYLPIYLYHFISGGSSIKEHIKAVNCGVMHSYRTRFFMCVSFGETAVCVCAALTVHPCVFHVPYAPCSLSTFDKVCQLICMATFGTFLHISLIFSLWVKTWSDGIRWQGSMHWRTPGKSGLVFHNMELCRMTGYRWLKDTTTPVYTISMQELEIAIP